MGVACRKFDTPVTGGNVSFYNQSTSGLAVYPTPTIGMVGIIESPQHRLSIPFKTEGAAIVLLGKPENDLGSSQYLAKLKNVEYSPCPSFDIDAEYNLHQVLGDLAGTGVVESVHDISEGGLFVACMESAMSGNLGFDICTDKQYRLDAYLFGESQSRVVVSLASEKMAELESICKKHGVDMMRIGTVTTSDSVIVNGEPWGSVSGFADGYNHYIGATLES